MRALLFALLLAGACAGTSNTWKPYTPVRAQVTAGTTREVAMQRALVALTDARLEIESSDADTGIVLSRWWSDDSLAGPTYQFRIRVVLGETGTYELAALCQKSENTDATIWGECESATTRPAFVLDALAKVDAALKQ